MIKKATKKESERPPQKELEKRIQIIGNIDDEELGFAVKNGLLRWWELRAWQELKETKR